MCEVRHGVGCASEGGWLYVDPMDLRLMVGWTRVAECEPPAPLLGAIGHLTPAFAVWGGCLDRGAQEADCMQVVRRESTLDAWAVHGMEGATAGGLGTPGAGLAMTVGDYEWPTFVVDAGLRVARCGEAWVDGGVELVWAHVHGHAVGDGEVVEVAGAASVDTASLGRSLVMWWWRVNMGGRTPWTSP